MKKPEEVSQMKETDEKDLQLFSLDAEGNISDDEEETTEINYDWDENDQEDPEKSSSQEELIKEPEDLEDIKIDIEPSTEPSSEPTKIEILRAKLKKSLSELEEIKSDMKNTFTSTDTISSTINSIKGMLDAIQKDMNS